MGMKNVGRLASLKVETLKVALCASDTFEGRSQGKRAIDKTGLSVSARVKADCHMPIYHTINYLSSYI